MMSDEQETGDLKSGDDSRTPDEFRGGSLLTGPDSDKGDAAAAAQEGEQGGDEAESVPAGPDGYELEFAETTQVDQDLLSDFQKAAHELGISRSKAQKLASMYEAYASRAAEHVRAGQQKVLEAAKTRWEAEIQSSAGFAQEREHARSALRQYGDAELYDLLDQTNLGSHPKMWAFLSKVGKALAEPGFHGRGSNRERSAAEIMYPDQGKN